MKACRREPRRREETKENRKEGGKKERNEEESHTKGSSPASKAGEPGKTSSTCKHISSAVAKLQ